jgi:hypothetical protein
MAAYCGAIVVHLPVNEGELHDILPLLKLLHYAPQVKCSFSCSMKDFQPGSHKNVDSMLPRGRELSAHNADGRRNVFCGSRHVSRCSLDTQEELPEHRSLVHAWARARVDDQRCGAEEARFPPSAGDQRVYAGVVRSLAESQGLDAAYLEEQAMWDVFMGVTGT